MNNSESDLKQEMIVDEMKDLMEDQVQVQDPANKFSGFGYTASAICLLLPANSRVTEFFSATR